MSRSIQIIGIPIDLGQSHRGVDLGPGAVRYAGLAARLEDLGYEVHDSGNLAVPVRESLAHEKKDRYLPTIKQVCGAACLAAREAVENKRIPIFIGGDHSISIGTVPGIMWHEPAGVLWIDAHGDFNNPESSMSGNIHGMSLAVLLGQGFRELVSIGHAGAALNAEDVAVVGVRNLDDEEREMLRKSGVTVYTMRDIDERGVATVIKEALEKLSHRKRLHVSLDIDVLDPQAAPGAGTLVQGGLTYREAQLMMESISDAERLCSVDVVEINPILDTHNKTAQTAVDLIASLFGQSIL
jgi:arginase